jgi:lipoprotein-anchoring transpeptidase ErfK/SrfK
MKIWIPLLSTALIAAAPPAGGETDRVTLRLPERAPDSLFDNSRSRDALLVQVLLDRSRHSPGAIDGMMGGNTRRAIKAYQRQHGLSVDGKISSALIRRLLDEQSGDVFKRYKISAEDLDRPFPEVPSEMADQAKLEKLGYERPAEALAERFHMAESFLIALNPGVDFSKVGTEINVVSAGPEELPAKVTRIEVDKKASSVRAYAEDGKLLASYPATIGSSSFPSPSGNMEVRAVAPAPKYYFDPEGRSWGPDHKVTIAAGPNNPVGSTWIDLSKDGYGIHGTPEPRLIGKTASHGCVRLTNWDAKELGTAVNRGTSVVFV